MSDVASPNDEAQAFGRRKPTTKLGIDKSRMIGDAMDSGLEIQLSTGIRPGKDVLSIQGEEAATQ